MENSTVEEGLNSSSIESLSHPYFENTFYWANGFPVTYMYFMLNLVMIVVHSGTIMLNSCMIVAVRRSLKVDEPSGHCLITLSVAYIAHSVMLIYTGIYGLANMQEKTECLMRFGLFHATCMFVGWANCLLTFDRYLQIEFPFCYKRKARIRNIWISNLVAALLFLFYGFTPLMFDWYNPQITRPNFCDYFNVLPTLHLQILQVILFAGFPFMLTAYIRLLCIASKHKASLARLAKSTAASKLAAARQRSNNWRTVKIVLSIFAVYLICWAPPALFSFILSLDPEYPKSLWKYQNAIVGVTLVPAISGIINPCCYALHREVKLRFLQLFKSDRINHSPSMRRITSIFGRLARRNSIRDTQIIETLNESFSESSDIKAGAPPSDLPSDSPSDSYLLKKIGKQQSLIIQSIVDDAKSGLRKRISV